MTEYQPTSGSLSQLNFEGRNKVEVAIERLRMFEPPEGYHLAFSGGKDSQAIEFLSRLAGVKAECHFYPTTVDPVEVLNFIREYYPHVIWDRPTRSMYRLIEEDGFPIRQHRSCCEEFKESHGGGRFVLTGIRWQESGNRKARGMNEVCNKGRGKRFLHPIIDWTEDEVWGFLNNNNLPHCSLYDEGFRRIGCILCPNHGEDEVRMELRRFPKVARAYQRAFEARWAKGLPSMKRWNSAEEMWQWWLSRKGQNKTNTQSVMFE